MRTRGWAEQSYAADSSSVSPLIHNETISSASAITIERCRPRFYLRLTPIIDVRGPVASSGHPSLWLGECLDVTAVGRNVLAETHPRFAARTEPLSRIHRRSRRGSPTLDDRRCSERYVACIVSFFGSQSSPFFFMAAVPSFRLAFDTSKLTERGVLSTCVRRTSYWRTANSTCPSTLLGKLPAVIVQRAVKGRTDGQSLYRHSNVPIS